MAIDSLNNLYLGQEIIIKRNRYLDIIQPKDKSYFKSINSTQTC